MSCIQNRTCLFLGQTAGCGPCSRRKKVSELNVARGRKIGCIYLVGNTHIIRVNDVPFEVEIALEMFMVVIIVDIVARLARDCGTSSE